MNSRDAKRGGKPNARDVKELRRRTEIEVHNRMGNGIHLSAQLQTHHVPIAGGPVEGSQQLEAA